MKEAEFIIVNQSKYSKKEKSELQFYFSLWFDLFSKHPQMIEKTFVSFTREMNIHGDIEKVKIKSIIKLNAN